MKQQFLKHLVPALLAMLVALTVVPFAESMIRLHAKYTPAIEWHGVQVLTPEVRPGDVLEIVYSATINKQCPSDLRGFLVAADGSVPVRFPVVSGGYRVPTPVPIDIPVKISIPAQSDPGLARLTSGPYIYRTLVTRYCSSGVEEDHSTPDVNFYLEVP